MSTVKDVEQTMKLFRCNFEEAMDKMGLPNSWCPDETEEELQAEYQEEVNQAFELELQECIGKNIFPTILSETEKYISICLKGSTFANKDYIKSLGFKFNSDKKIWGMNFKTRNEALKFFSKF